MAYLCLCNSKTVALLRYFLELSYHGGAYHGWQRQPKEISVQEKLEQALEQLLGVPIEVLGAGRTDAGVHARQLYAHFDVAVDLPVKLDYMLNSILPLDIAVKEIFEVPEQAHARFDALARTYEYHIVHVKDPFVVDTAYFLKRPVDIEQMNMAAKILLEYSDFKCFSRSRTDVKTYNCEIEYAFWEQREDKLVFEIKANRFLRNMVRAIVGTLLEVGRGKLTVGDMHQIIASRDRSRAGASVPAHGLFLTGIEYPETILKK